MHSFPICYFLKKYETSKSQKYKTGNKICLIRKIVSGITYIKLWKSETLTYWRIILMRYQINICSYYMFKKYSNLLLKEKLNAALKTDDLPIIVSGITMSKIFNLWKSWYPWDCIFFVEGSVDDQLNWNSFVINENKI